MTIYPFDRKTYIENTIKEGKKSPGVATYDITKFDEKFEKPPQKAIMNLYEERYTTFDEINFLKKQIPSFYNEIPIVSVTILFFELIQIYILIRKQSKRRPSILKFDKRLKRKKK
jgi:hypothetical protein